MNHIGLKLGPLGYRVIDLPPLPQDARDNFANLPEDPYYTERWRQFSQYVLFFEHDHWACRILEHRPFIQAKAYNQKVGGVRRNFEPISGVDPTPQFAAIASELDFDRNAVFQVNLHQWRTRVNETYQGKTIPEGPHRDGHHITSVTVWERHNITGGESTLYQVGKTDPFFEQALHPGQCLVMRDEDMVHGARDIHAVSGEGGYRDIWVISINPWADRRYGEEFEAFATAEPASIAAE
ncbi:2OG-Fe dioxygenase family protein [Roseovarius tibetensis]|uniref:2OG-Fe dioxygenase family protein n=1 Tax=Roseovarius tibetensis TaxID=2685897 RepID=UPI003D7F291A